MVKKSITAALTAGLLAGGLVSALPAQAATSGSLKWGKCSSPRLQKAGAQCASLTVPMDAANPKGDKVTLAISRVKHTVPDSQYQGVMLVNPGGPGGSGLGLSTLGKYVPGGAGNAYDWIGFDPRGVGSSTPSLNCQPDYFGYNRPDYIPTTHQKEKVWLDRSKSYAKTCGAKYGKLLEHLKTTDSVADMESIRKALGAKQINYYGFSYGTYLGQVYSTLHPDRMRRMVLDSNVDPRKVWYEANLDQDIAFDRNIKIWFTWVAKYDNVYHLGNSEKKVEKLWYDQRAKLTKKPAGGKIGPDEWTDIFLQAGYYRFGWEDMGKAFSDWIHKGDSKQLIDLYAPNNTAANENGFAVYNAVQCTDTQWPRSYNQWRSDAWRTYAKAPFETWDNNWFNAPCLNWKGKAGTPVEVDGSKVKSGLLIGEELDAATPFTGSIEVRKRYPNARLIGEPGGATHADSLSGDACVDNKVADYLRSGALPPAGSGDGPDVECAPIPDPVPKAASSPSGSSTQQSMNKPSVANDLVRAATTLGH
jgi:pimeloyl-ACP methyl ester carboxylesterase